MMVQSDGVKHILIFINCIRCPMIRDYPCVLVYEAEVWICNNCSFIKLKHVN